MLLRNINTRSNSGSKARPPSPSAKTATKSLLIKNEGPVREILGRHRSVMHRERLQRCRGVRLHSMPREVRCFGGCTGEHKRGAREHNQIFPHGNLLTDVQESNAPAASTAVT